MLEFELKDGIELPRGRCHFPVSLQQMLEFEFKVKRLHLIKVGVIEVSLQQMLEFELKVRDGLQRWQPKCGFTSTNVGV
jgi:hypothetical protein